MGIISLKTFEQIGRYYLTGILINVLGYGAFLLLLDLGLGAKSSSALLFVVSMMGNFWMSRAYVFKSRVALAPSFSRYVLTALLALLLNVGILWVFVDHCGMPAEYVQLFSIVFISVFLFVINKFIVHKASE
ncbi:GtrA family protein [Neorhizobium galegae]|uniref:GtrA family protein n=1 Tax=Neorhizobium galegae TaxID=399 RepID=A0A6A1TIV8_NEOGA|nr:GtrA family protein [Neorhizobium galegae]KAB1083645.1 GtrA family protein [Neorhizobium galegae]